MPAGPGSRPTFSCSDPGAGILAGFGSPAAPPGGMRQHEHVQTGEQEQGEQDREISQASAYESLGGGEPPPRTYSSLMSPGRDLHWRLPALRMTT